MLIALQRIVLRPFTALGSGLGFISRGITSWIPTLVLFAGITFWHITADIETIGPRIICAAACLAAIRAARNSAYFWVAACGGIAVIFNPFVPDMLSRIALFTLYSAFTSATLAGLAVLKFGPWQPARIVSLAVHRVALDCKENDRGFMKLLLRIFQFAFMSCHHGQMSRVFTIKKRTYRVCINCGQEFEIAGL